MDTCLFAHSTGCVFDSGATAAWLQALGSVGAILFSSGLAIAVPIYLRGLEERASVQRALLACNYVASHVLGVWTSFEELYLTEEFGSHSLELIEGQLALIDRIAGAVEVTRLGPNALTILSNTHDSRSVLRHVARKAVARELGEEARAGFIEAREDAMRMLAALGAFEPVRVQGVWLGDRPNFWKE